MKSRIVFCLPVVSIALLLLSSPARAVDGVLEINQTCAVQTGCFPGDTTGFPVTIDSTTPGTSFRLTSDLVIPDTNPGGIQIVFVDSVSVDLNHFSIVRAACLANHDPACTPTSGTANGVSVNDPSSRIGISVRNGNIVGMGQHGVALGSDSEVLNVKVRWNRLHGISVGSGSTVSGCAARENGDVGITSGEALITGNSSINNGGDGVFAFGGAISGNVIVGNGGDGVENLGLPALVEGNVVQSNTGYGLRITSGPAAYRSNVIDNNTAGTVTGGIDVGANVCDGAATCP